jgi:hypothetical protein
LVVILLLLVIWGGVGAWWFLNRPEGHSSDSIGSFRHQLRVLERTGPTTVRPAYRMNDGELGVYGASRSAYTRPVRPQPSPASRRRQVQKRRRDVFYGLLASVVGAAALGFLPGLSVMWWLSVLLAMVLGVYVVVLAQLQSVAADRSRKVRSIEYAVGRSRAFAAYSEAEPGYLLRRSAN